MAILARGAEEVRALEVALGGKPPRKAVERSHAELKRQLSERWQARKAMRATVNPLLEQARAPLLEVIGADPGAVRAAKELRHFYLERHKEKPRHKPARLKVEPSMASGSGISIKVPPYDAPFQASNGTGAASADVNTGGYNFWLEGKGGSSGAGAGVGLWFLATEDNPQQRVAALVDYDYAWLDSSMWYTAHNDGGTYIWVWGSTENGWVLQTPPLAPNWSDGTGWAETHGSGGDGSEQFGRESLQAFFNAVANHWYFVWVFSNGSCDDAGASLVGYSWASQWQSMSVPFVVFGSL